MIDSAVIIVSSYVFYFRRFYPFIKTDGGDTFLFTMRYDIGESNNYNLINLFPIIWFIIIFSSFCIIINSGFSRMSINLLEFFAYANSTLIDEKINILGLYIQLNKDLTSSGLLTDILSSVNESVFIKIDISFINSIYLNLILFISLSLMFLYGLHVYYYYNLNDLQLFEDHKVIHGFSFLSFDKYLYFNKFVKNIQTFFLMVYNRIYFRSDSFKYFIIYYFFDFFVIILGLVFVSFVLSIYDLFSLLSIFTLMSQDLFVNSSIMKIYSVLLLEHWVDFFFINDYHYMVGLIIYLLSYDILAGYNFSLLFYDVFIRELLFFGSVSKFSFFSNLIF